MIALFTDFGVGSHYLGQVKARLLGEGVTLPIIDLCSDAPVFDPRSSAYLLASFLEYLPEYSIVLAVVDPGVGSARRAILAQMDGHWVLAPDNGLLSIALKRSECVSLQTILLDLPHRSRTFDGRDYFAPAAARLCQCLPLPGEIMSPEHMVGYDWPDRSLAIIYIDHYGNAVSGLFGEMLSPNQKIVLNGIRINYAETFSSVNKGTAFWYVNANNLIEIAVNSGSAAEKYALTIGSPLEIER
ncbi:MAG: SAM-dependent chlorinase/fluorinase [Sedimenticola sp.]|nr:SAM-dependent chlorinase/fluorinase [Sedimenticola sp.]